MVKVKSICVMKDLFCSLAEMEAQLQQRHGLSFNEAMVLCCIGSNISSTTPEPDDTGMTASSISENTGLTPSHTSKVIRSVEAKGLVSRTVGSVDHRQMCFKLTEEGNRHLYILKTEEITIPEFIRPLFDS